MFRIKFYVFLSLISMALLLLSSCISREKPHPVNEWVLGDPDPIHLSGIILETVPFTNCSEVSTSMMYRTNEYRVEFDPYNRWAKSPNILLELYVRRALNIDENYASGSSEDVIFFTLAAGITNFEIDFKNNKVRLGISYKIKYMGDVLIVKNEVFEEGFKDKNPSEFARAMSSAAGEFVKTLVEQLYVLKTDVLDKEKHG
jgi:hypothetical protein